MNGKNQGLSAKRVHRSHAVKSGVRIPDRPNYGRRTNVKQNGKLDHFVWLAKFTRVLVIIGCTAAFIFYIYNFFNMYWEYPTVVDVSVSFPDEPDLPAITVCNHNVLRKSALYNVNRTIYERISTYNNRSTILRHTLAALEMDAILNMTLNKTDLFYNCSVKSETKSRDVQVCNASVWLYFQKKLCFVLNSEWTVHDSQIRLLGNDSEFRLVLDLHPEDYFIPNTTAAEIYIHSGIALPDSRSSHFTAWGGKSYNVGIQKTTVKLLESPYQTMCTNYTKKHMNADEDSKLENLGKRICYQQCLAKFAVMPELCEETCIPECLVYMTNYLPKYGVCTSSTKKQEVCCGNIMSKKAKCNERCPLECNVQLYDIQYSEDRYTLDPDSQEEDFKPKNTSMSLEFVEIKFNLQMVRHTTYTHNPKITSIEILGYVGGYLGIWLGVSIPLLYDYIMKFLLSLKRGIQKKRHFKDIFHPSNRLSTGDSNLSVKTIR